MARRATGALIVLALAPAGAYAANPTWLQERRVEPGQTTIYGLSCPAIATCIAAAGAGPVVEDGDYPAEPDTDPDPSNGLAAVSCAPGTKFCMFVDDGGGAFTYNNGTFGSRASIDGTTELHDVSCPTATFCMAIDHNHKVIKYANGSWDGGTTLTVPGTFHPFVSVSCTSASFCVALANKDSSGTYGTVAFTYNGSTWSSASAAFDTSTATQAYATGVSCTSSTFCMAGHEEGKVSTFNGVSWTTSASAIDTYNAHPLPRVRCIGTTCMAVDFYDNWTRTTNGGTTWSPLVNFKSDGLPSGIGGIASLACATATLCVAGDGLGQVTTFAVPPATGAPTIAGSAFVGQMLTLTHVDPGVPGAWLRDRWWRCDNPGSGCNLSPISSSPSAYTLVADDTDEFIEAREVSGFGFFFSAESASNSIGPVCNGTCGSPDGGGTGGGGSTGGSGGTSGTGGTSGGGTDTTSGAGGSSAPTLSGVSAPTAHKGAAIKLSLTLGGPASSVRVTFKLKSKGRKVGGKCVAQTRRNRKKRSCTRYVTVGTVSFANVPAGDNVLSVTKVHGHALKPGTYRVTVEAVDQAGNSVSPAVVTVKVTR